MLTFEEMLIRLGISVLLGWIIGFERELVGKSAGVRTDTLVAAGATLFTMAGIMIHWIIGNPPGQANYMQEVMSSTRGISIIAGIVTGIGFLGAGLIIKEKFKVRGVTTAASIWFVAAVGMLVGLGLVKLASVATIGVVAILYGLRKLDLFSIIEKEKRRKEFIKREKEIEKKDEE
ncbi:MAG: MgtC/SapB family protein [Candidatus Magasanikbacteria bacterium]